MNEDFAKVKVPHSMSWGLAGWHGVAELTGVKGVIKVDLSIPTDRQLTSRRPDIVLHLKDTNRIVILECAVTWEPLLEERECEKFHKYQDLAADLATQYPGSRVTVIPIAVGSLGTLRNLRENLNSLAIFTRREVDNLAKSSNLRSSVRQ